MEIRLKGAVTAAALISFLLISGCSSHITKGDAFAKHNDWIKAIQEYRKAYAENPDNIEAKMRLKQIEIKGSDYYYHKGEYELASNNLNGAIEQFQYGLMIMPDNDKLLEAKRQTDSKVEAAQLYKEAVNLIEAGKIADGRLRLQHALELFPDYPEAINKLKALTEAESADEEQKLILSSSRPITLNFKETDIRDSYEFLTKSFGVNVIFDESVKDRNVTLFAKDVTFTQGLSLLLATSKTFYRKIGPNSILVSADNKEKRRQYEDQIVRTFELNTIRAKDMADILKGTMSINKLVINEQLNNITVRDTPEIISLIEKMIQNNDRKRAEVILDVEILEINRTKAENLGLDFGSYKITAAVEPYPLTGSFDEAQRTSGTLTLPSATLQFMKKDVDARVLANPRIRVLSNMSAKIHIGDRVPLIATTIQDATGQIRNTYDYKDIGIQLSTEPIVHLDNSVTVKLGLEVSTLGQNLGTPLQPAYSIGSRSAETSMLLRDGETAVLGGLIQDNERNNRVRIAGLGDIPVIGSLFTSYDDSNGRTDVLLTITPRVVRGWDVPQKSERQFYSGTQDQYLDKQLFAELNTTAVNKAGTSLAPTIDTNGIATKETNSDAARRNGAVDNVDSPVIADKSEMSTSTILGFDKAVYEVATGDDFFVDLMGNNLSGLSNLPISVLFNTKVINYVDTASSAEVSQNISVAADNAKGILTGDISTPFKVNTPTVIAHVKMHATTPGVSYLIYRSTTGVDVNGNSTQVQLRASRVVVK